MIFTGNHEHQIDTKHRLAIPADMRRQLRRLKADDELTMLYVTYADHAAGLCLWPEEVFQRRASEIESSQRPASEVNNWELDYFALAGSVEMDRQGRVRLPENMLAHVGLTTEVTVIGVNDHMEIWDRQAWRSHMEKLLLERGGRLMHPRRLMRTDPQS